MMYRGRFAPSPTGPLHFGSLVAAAASYVEARARGGRWLVRMEDLDTPRNQPGSAGVILRQLEAYGFEWDEPVLCQSARIEAYGAALDRLRDAGQAFPCGCSRKEVCVCSAGLPPGRAARAWRVRGGDEFVLLRADGIFAYQLAVVVDDEYQRITDVVRGDDLADSTRRHQHLQRLLSLPSPRYRHVPVVRDASGEKLSKQTLAPALPLEEPALELRRALAYLELPAGAGTVADLWKEAISSSASR